MDWFGLVRINLDWAARSSKNSLKSPQATASSWEGDLPVHGAGDLPVPGEQFLGNWEDDLPVIGEGGLPVPGGLPQRYS